jgi:hypothetical protein
MSLLGPLAGEPPEPMAKEQFDATRKRIRDSWNGSVTLPKRELEQLVAEISWLKRRLQRVEHAIEPLVEGLTSQDAIHHCDGLRNSRAVKIAKCQRSVGRTTLE